MKKLSIYSDDTTKTAIPPAAPAPLARRSRCSAQGFRLPGPCGFSLAAATPLLVLVGVLLVQLAQAAVLFTEEYPTAYGDGTGLGNNVTNGGYNTKWPNGNSSGTGNPICTSAGALTYSGLSPISGSPSYGFRIATATSRNAVAPFASQSGNGNSVYWSFLIKVTATTPIARQLGGFRNSTGGGNLAGGVGIDSSRRLTLYKNNAVVATHSTTLNTDQIYFVVLRYKFTASTSTDEVALWLNPLLGKESESEAGVTPITGTSGSGQSTILALHLLSAADTTDPLYLDEYRVATTWAEATPSEACNPAEITAQPADQAGFVGTTATFAIGATGSSRTFQWQVSTNGGTDWDSVSTGSGGTSASYSTPALTTEDNGNQHRCIVNVACDSSSVTSTVATLTVYDPTGVSFRSATSGTWGAASTWEWSTNNGASWAAAPASPTAGNSTNILLQSGHSVTNLATITGGVDELTIESGGLLVVSGATFAIADGAAAADCDVSGIIQVNNVTGSTVAANPGAGLTFRNGSRYVWTRADAAAAIPTATWEDGSTCEIQNCTAATPTGLGQSFYDFYWNKTSSGAVSLGGQLTTVRNNLRMRGSSDSANSVRFLATTMTNNLHVGGDVVVEGGFITLSGGSTVNTVLNLFVGRNFLIASGATWDSRNSGAGSSVNILFTNTTTPQVLTNLGAISHTGSGGGCPINWKVNSAVTLALAGGNIALFTANNNTRDSVTLDGTLQMGGQQFTGPGTLTVNASATLLGNSTNQLTSGLHTINYGGMLNLPGLPVLNNGDSFKLFDATNTYSGAFGSIVPATPGAGLFWDTTGLAVDGVLKVAAPPVAQPQFASVVLSGADLILSGSSGPANGDYHVLTSTNVGLALTSWSVLATNQFDGSGNFVFTNAISPGVPHQFYMIQVP